MPAYTAQPAQVHNREFDVLIAGGGITGITTALQLQKLGLKCVVAEAHNLCFGTTGGTTAHLNTFLDYSYDHIEKNFGEDGAQLVAKATMQALELYRANVEEYSIDCGYQQKDGYLYAQTHQQAEALQKIFEASKKAGVDVAYTDRIPVSIDFEKAIVYHEQANVHPSRYVYALARAFEAAGGVILQNCMVEHPRGEGILQVETSHGTIQTKNLIWATHIPPGINLLDFRCAPYRSYALAVTLKDESYPGDLAYDMYDPYHYYRTQEIDGKKYFIVGGEDHKTAHVINTDECFNKLEAHTRRHFDIDEIAFKWSSQYYQPADGLPYIGHLPGAAENVFVATGYSGNGMTLSHVAAILLTDLITKGKNEYAELFDPGRVKPVAGFTKFVKENADVAKEFFTKRLAREKITELASLAPGEAKLVRYEGKALALYKDEQGGLHAVNPVCPHAKCSVDWNRAEKSWDCPCHGSRFTPDGEVITGPSHHNLEAVAIEDLVNEEKH
jgi:glycine/D-amino acid oxidase-like deaminating enzyme/nitrite reductase/ring-hydroxylating ferredoxin subunit